MTATTAAMDRFSRLLEGFRNNVPNNRWLRETIISSLPASHALLPFTCYERLLILPEINDDWNQECHDILGGLKIVRTIHDGTISSSSLLRLNPGQFLNDFVIECYSKLISDNGGCVTSTRFLLNCRTGHRQNKEDRETGPERLKKHGHMFVPVHHKEDLHWSFLRMWLKENKLFIEHYDSLPYHPIPHFGAMLDTYFATFPQGLFVTRQAKSPLQRNGADCGLFILMGIRLMVSGSEHLSQEHADAIMPTFREKILSEILAHKLDPTTEDLSEFLTKERELEGRPQVAAAVDHRPYTGAGLNTDPISLLSPESEADPIVPDEQLLESGQIESSAKQVGKTGLATPGVDVAIPALLPCDGPGILKEMDELDISLETLGSVEIQDTPDTTMFVSPAAAPRSRYAGQVEALVASFGNHEIMTNSIRRAVSFCRINATQVTTDRYDLYYWWISCSAYDDVNPQQILNFRLSRLHFSTLYFDTHADLKARFRSKKHREYILRDHLRCDKTGYQAAQAYARKTYAWRELVALSEAYLGFKSHVALLAYTGATTFLEALDTESRKLFLEGIQERLNDTTDLLGWTLQTAHGLVEAVALGQIPSYELRIESTIRSPATFAENMSLLEPSRKLRLP